MVWTPWKKPRRASLRGDSVEERFGVSPRIFPSMARHFAIGSAPPQNASASAAASIPSEPITTDPPAAMRNCDCSGRARVRTRAGSRKCVHPRPGTALSAAHLPDAFKQVPVTTPACSHRQIHATLGALFDHVRWLSPVILGASILALYGGYCCFFRFPPAVWLTGFVLWLASWHLGMIVISILPERGYHDLIHSLKTGWMIPFCVVAVGLPILTLKPKRSEQYGAGNP